VNNEQLMNPRIERLNDLVIQSTKDGNIRYISPSFEKILGNEPGELIGYNFFELIHRDECQNFQEAHGETQRDGKCRFVPYRIKSASGAYIWLSTDLHPVITADGNISDILCISRLHIPDPDNTLVNNVEDSEVTIKSLKNEIERYRYIYANNLDGVVEVDDRITCIGASKVFCEMVGYTEDELIGISIPTLEVGVPFEEIQRRIGIIKASDGLTFETHFLRKNGSLVEVEATTIQDHNMINYISFVRDITDRKLAEETLRRSEERYRFLAEENKKMAEKALEDASEKAELLQEVNHRVKNNLSSIIGLLYAEERFNKTGLPINLRGLISRVEGLAIVHNLLSSSHWMPISAEEIARKIITGCLRSVPLDKVISVEVSPSVLMVNPKQANSLSLIINELVINSLKHALPVSDSLTINFQIDINDDKVIMRYSDDGPGYPESVLDKKKQNVGLYLISSICTHDLQGEVKFFNDQGAVTLIYFNFSNVGYLHTKIN
jgi:PAS domain S-box-containing protein